MKSTRMLPLLRSVSAANHPPHIEQQPSAALMVDLNQGRLTEVNAPRD
jgi:hypothetical protein